MSGSRSTMITLEQRRAKHAWEAVDKLKKRERPVVGGSDKDRKAIENQVDEYAREAKKLPMRIHAAGLGQAVAFLVAKDQNKGGPRKWLHDDVSAWVLRERRLAAPGATSNSLRDHVIQGNAMLLRRQTEEALAYLEWLNRLLEGEGLPRKESD